MNNWEVEMQNKINKLNNIKDSLTKDEYIEKCVLILTEYVYAELKTSIKEKRLHGIQSKPIYEQILDDIPHNPDYKKIIEVDIIEEVQNEIVEKPYTTINWIDVIKNIK